MDIPRNRNTRGRRARYALLILLAIAALGGGGWAVTRMEPALPDVEAAGVWSDTVRRGPMVRQVHGVGSLVPQNVVWVSAQIDGRIERINVKAGDGVRPGMVLMELSNPTLVEALTAAQFDLKQAEAAYADLEVTLQNARFDRESAAAQVSSDYHQARIKAERDERLAAAGLMPSVDARLSVVGAREQERRQAIEEKRMRIIDRSADAQLAAQRVKIDQFKAVYELKRQQVEELHVRASIAGILQQIGNSPSNPTQPLEVGQNVVAGSVLARVARPDELKAQIRIAETDARDVALGQPAEIDTHNGVVPGKVSRIDPAAVNGAVLVDIVPAGPMPLGARPDLTVDGSVELERLPDVLLVNRPAAGQAGGSVALFRLDGDGKTASHVRVRFGRASVNAIEIVDGLRAGDRVILSDMSAVEKYDRIRIK